MLEDELEARRAPDVQLVARGQGRGRGLGRRLHASPHVIQRARVLVPRRRGRVSLEGDVRRRRPPVQQRGLAFGRQVLQRADLGGCGRQAQQHEAARLQKSLHVGQVLPGIVRRAVLREVPGIVRRAVLREVNGEDGVGRHHEGVEALLRGREARGQHGQLQLGLDVCGREAGPDGHAAVPVGGRNARHGGRQQGLREVERDRDGGPRRPVRQRGPFRHAAQRGGVHRALPRGVAVQRCEELGFPGHGDRARLGVQLAAQTHATVRHGGRELIGEARHAAAREAPQDVGRRPAADRPRPLQHERGQGRRRRRRALAGQAGGEDVHDPGDVVGVGAVVAAASHALGLGALLQDLLGLPQRRGQVGREAQVRAQQRHRLLPGRDALGLRQARPLQEGGRKGLPEQEGGQLQRQGGEAQLGLEGLVGEDGRGGGVGLLSEGLPDVADGAQLGHVRELVLDVLADVYVEARFEALRLVEQPGARHRGQVRRGHLVGRRRAQLVGRAPWPRPQPLVQGVFRRAVQHVPQQDEVGRGELRARAAGPAGPLPLLARPRRQLGFEPRDRALEGREAWLPQVEQPLQALLQLGRPAPVGHEVGGRGLRPGLPGQAALGPRQREGAGLLQNAGRLRAHVAGPEGRVIRVQGPRPRLVQGGLGGLGLRGHGPGPQARRIAVGLRGPVRRAPVELEHDVGQVGRMGDAPGRLGHLQALLRVQRRADVADELHGRRRPLRRLGPGGAEALRPGPHEARDLARGRVLGLPPQEAAGEVDDAAQRQLKKTPGARPALVGQGGAPEDAARRQHGGAGGGHVLAPAAQRAEDVLGRLVPHAVYFVHEVGGGRLQGGVEARDVEIAAAAGAGRPEAGAVLDGPLVVGRGREEAGLRERRLLAGLDGRVERGEHGPRNRRGRRRGLVEQAADGRIEVRGQRRLVCVELLQLRELAQLAP